MNGLATISQMNNDHYWDIVKQLDPEFYLIRIALEETSVNALILPKVIRAINNLAIGTGYGRVSIYMSAGKVTQIKTEESDQVQEDAIIDSK